jgi:superfamily II DNA or RNA helicase
MYLQTQLMKAFSAAIRQRGFELFRSRMVVLLGGDQWEVSAKVRGSKVYAVDLSRQDDEIYVFCDCPFFETESACKHIWATILAADEKKYLRGAGSNGPLQLVEDFEPEFDDDLDDEDEVEDEDFPFSSRVTRRFAPPAPPKPPTIPAWRKLLQDLNNQPAGGANAPRRVDREIYYIIDADSTIRNQRVCLNIENRERLQNGGWGKPKPLRGSLDIARDVSDPLDREILTALTGAAHAYHSYYEEPAPATCHLKNAAPDILLPKICATGRCRVRTGAVFEFEALPALQWDEGDPWQFRLVVERQDKSWILRGILRRGEEQMDLAEPALLLENLLIARGKVSRLNSGGSFGWIATLRKSPSSIKVPAAQGPELVAEILKSAHLPEIDWPEELRVEEVTAVPRPVLKFSEHKGWSKVVMQGKLLFDYDGAALPYDGHFRGLHQPEQKRYLRRDAAAEQAAIQTLSDLGVKQAQERYGPPRPEWEVAPKKLPAVVRELVKAGWHVEAEGKAFRRASGMRTEFSSGVDWFELRAAADYDGVEILLPELLKAVQRGDQMVALSDGSFGMLPEDFLEKYGLLTRLGRAQGDHVRFSASQAGLLDVLLAARPEIRVDEIFARARVELRSFEGIQPAAQPAGFEGQLRAYQCEGLAWMYFLQRLGFGGCLADDMGVGKTPQVLALLETRRELREEKSRAIGPSLAVVPRSLIYNWEQEAARFTPRLRVLDHTGVGREKGAESFADYDLILTTYGTLRRDIALLQEYQFDYVILDEAQAIKNEKSESAKAVRLLQANHRLALSGTPIENHLGELWSLFEFLNPGMLGAGSSLRVAGSALRNPDEETRQLLAKALRPFVLRRTKAQVVKELPEKTEQTVYCEMDATQRKLYDELREHYRQTLLGRIESEGMAKSKMHILEALLRLRQAACHPGLLDQKRANQSSAKFEALMPQLTEVLAEGHKALVFSQFTSLLAILRHHLEAAGMRYEYLDGQTQNRQAHVERFQGDPDYKLFLISLKAGGLGLNLTAAEYVFLLDPWWNPAVEAQAIDRAHRIGQSRPVFAYRLIARNTVEEKVLELQKSKKALADAIIGEDNRLVSNLKREDLELLLS